MTASPERHRKLRVKIVRRLPRPLAFPDKALARPPAGTLKRIEIVLRPGEHQAAFLRSAIERELQIRERVKLVWRSAKCPRGEKAAHARL